MSIDQAKMILRAEARKRRTAISGGLTAVAGEQAAAMFMQHVELSAGDSLAGYAPTLSEIDCRPLMSAIYAQGHDCALPVITDPASPLTFVAWRPGAPLVPGAFGIKMPEDQSRVLLPNVILVPLLAFDVQGHRLGYGGGYYDRTIEFLRHRHGRGAVRAIGIAFDAQRVDKVPHAIHDQPLDGVVTEANFYDMNMKAG